jgi:hypothetical protein
VRRRQGPHQTTVDQARRRGPFGRPTHFSRRAADAAAPIQSNDSERLPRSAGVKSSAGEQQLGMNPKDSAHDPANGLSDTHGTARQPGPQARAPNGPPRFKPRLRRDAGKALSKTTAGWARRRGPRPTNSFFTPSHQRRGTDPVQRLGKAAKTSRRQKQRGSASGRPATRQLPSRCIRNQDPGHVRSYLFPKNQEARSGPAGGRGACVSSGIKVTQKCEVRCEFSAPTHPPHRK